MKNCNGYNSCSAPVCPLDPDRKRSIWYPGEEICKAQKQNESFIRVQRKISKRTRDMDGYYSLAMLNQNPVIRTGITGINPDKRLSEEQQIENWLKKHPKRDRIPVIFSILTSITGLYWGLSASPRKKAYPRTF